MSRSLLAVDGLYAGYGSVQVLRDIDLTIGTDEVVVLLGSNGAGKTTLLRALTNLIPWRGSIEFDGTSTHRKRTELLTRRGIAHVPQGRGTFVELTVEENLRVGGLVTGSRAEVEAGLERWFAVYPRLAERRRQLAGSLSGGEQQMLAIARALMSGPRLLLLDEPSLGLSPLVTEELFEHLAALKAERELAMIIVEQTAELALAIADRAHVLRSGELLPSRSASELKDADVLREAYFGA
ncbi:ABC transporter ATP-binding protein [Leucobacter allii]|uniref:ABC transporter ATP-binding protein n=1 Tax=Leucobacter allii TaxID=2932247 RepID=UPI001FD4592C|nr:ABC transporter ATP-binding protein [Leucobacter allii]UOR01524.1 ABC transporter ATP-binding protein [Leucobacter allii]